jgi:hypothetical protein
VCALPCYVVKIYFSFFLPSMPRSSKWSLSGFPTETLYVRLPQICYMPCPSHPLWFVHANNIWWVHTRILKVPIMQFSPVSSCLLGPTLFLSTLFSNTPR